MGRGGGENGVRAQGLRSVIGKYQIDRERLRIV